MNTIAKGNRSKQVTNARRKYEGFQPGPIGEPADLPIEENIKKVECIDYPETRMEAVQKIQVEDFPSFMLMDDTGNNLYSGLMQKTKPGVPLYRCFRLQVDIGINSCPQGSRPDVSRLENLATKTNCPCPFRVRQCIF